MNDDEREWRHTLDHLSQGDDEIAQEAAAALEAATLRMPAAHFDANSAFGTMPDGTIIDKDDLLAHARPPAKPQAD